MKTERWQQINDLFQSAAERAPDERAAFLDEACHGDERLCHDVKLLIASYERTENFIEAPAFEEAPELLTNDRAGALVGELVGHYRIESLIGVGGMGEVYLARDELLGRKVALKFLPQSLTEDEEQLNRLEHEARTASALNHPNILTVHEIGIDGRRHFIATEFIEGETLRAVLSRGKLDLRDALNIAIQVGSALAAAHKSGVLHRDIKPENIMLRPDGYVKVLDFGIAKLAEQKEPASHAEGPQSAPGQTQSGLVVGTAHYMSPEQARGQTVDARTDIWSFGVVLFEMLAGRPPFEGKTSSECIAAVLSREPPLLALKAQQVPTRAEQIVRKALRKDKEERYQAVEEMLSDLRRLRESSESTVSGWKPQAKLIVLAASVVVALVVAGLFIYLRPTRTETNSLAGNASAPASVISEKSIAVLPFENLSEEKANAFFADGVQDEILTNLARVGDLKVISRASVMQYKSGVTRNLRKIGQQLGVAHLLEGSVQRAANRVRVNAKLIDARTDTHLWAQTYDRDLADVFAIQSEIAKAIADQLQAKLSPNEKKAIEQPPTTDLAAFDLYSWAKSLLLTADFSATQEPDVRKAIELLDDAVKRDPSFFDAYCQLAYAHEYLYAVWGSDHTPARLALAEAALQAATQLRPDAAETHLARAQYLYFGLRDYAGSLAELEITRRALPNDPRLFELTGLILRRRGQHEEGLRNLERAVELDPRNFSTLQQIAQSYQGLGRYAEAIAAFDRALAIMPDSVETRSNRGLYYLCWKAVTRPLHQTIDAILAQGPSAIVRAADNWFFCALAERDPASAERALVALGDNPCWNEGVFNLSRSFGEGLLARMTKDEARARAAFEAARTQQEKIVQAQPDHGPVLCVLGLIDAALGRKDLALDEGRRAIALTPLEKDVINGSVVLQYFAITAAWAGEKELALQQLEAGLRAPVVSFMLSYGALKLFPVWDPLRGDPRFEQIVASVAPKPVQKSAPDKSIAVLPFENLSRDPDNAFFTDGVQDEILMHLAKIADLKVVSRTSVMQYKSGVGRNLREISQQLGVAHLLEGSVQRAANRVRVNAQLIDARTDAHLWAQTYDRDLADVFAIQREIAKAIADQLQAQLSPAEKTAIEKPPTTDLAAFDLYTRGKTQLLTTAFTITSAQNFEHAVELLNRAVTRDPVFVEAYYQLAYAHGRLYSLGLDHTASRLASAEAALQAAIRLRPDAGETHLARAQYLYYCRRDYANALAELENARRSLPNDPRILELTGYILRRRGQQEEALRHLEKALILDPRNYFIMEQIALSYQFLRRYPEEAAILDRALTISPKDAARKVQRALVDFYWKADTKPLHQAIGSILAEDSGAISQVADSWFICALAEHDHVAAERALVALVDNRWWADAAVILSRSFAEGLLARVMKDEAKARAAFSKARAEQEKIVQAQPDYAPALCVLGLIDAALGRKEAALEEARRAVELLPVEKDSVNGSRMLVYFAIVAAWAGEKDLALQQLELGLRAPLPSSALNYGALKLLPFWDPLRGDPRFEKLVEEAKQPVGGDTW